MSSSCPACERVNKPLMDRPAIHVLDLSAPVYNFQRLQNCFLLLDARFVTQVGKYLRYGDQVNNQDHAIGAKEIN